MLGGTRTNNHRRYYTAVPDPVSPKHNYATYSGRLIRLTRGNAVTKGHEKPECRPCFWAKKAGGDRKWDRATDFMVQQIQNNRLIQFGWGLSVHF